MDILSKLKSSRRWLSGKLRARRAPLGIMRPCGDGKMYTGFAASPQHRRIAILKVATSIDYAIRYEESLTSTHDYCQRRGYELLLYIAQDEDWKPTGARHFSKIPGIRAALDMGFDRVLFSDLDTLISNPEIRIEDWTHPDADLLIQKEEVICSCVFVLKNSAWSRQFLESWWNLGIEHDCRMHSYDQIAYWGALMGEDRPEVLRQAQWPTYCSWLNENIPERTPRIGWIEDPPLHSAPWNHVNPQEALILHTGNLYWDHRHQLLRASGEQKKQLIESISQ